MSEVINKNNRAQATFSITKEDQIINSNSSAVRKKILESYSAWTALSALGSSPGHKKDRKSIYALLNKINFKPILDKSKGTITKEEFSECTKTQQNKVPVITVQGYQPQYGWATKLINI